MTKKKIVTVQVEVPCYTVRAGLKCADSIIDVIEQIHPVVVQTANGTDYAVKSVTVR